MAHSIDRKHDYHFFFCLCFPAVFGGEDLVQHLSSEEYMTHCLERKVEIDHY